MCFSYTDWYTCTLYKRSFNDADGSIVTNILKFKYSSMKQTSQKVFKRVKISYNDLKWVLGCVQIVHLIFCLQLHIVDIAILNDIAITSCLHRVVLILFKQFPSSTSHWQRWKLDIVNIVDIAMSTLSIQCELDMHAFDIK